jgi:glycosyltransferase involved in cell wall biosynthesis
MMDPYVLAVFSNAYPASERDSSSIFMRKMVEGLREKGVEVRLAAKTSRSLLGYLPFYLSSLRLARDPSVDILQAHYIPHSGIIPWLLKGKRPLVIKFHGDDGRIFPFKNPLYRAITRMMIRRADHVLTASEEIRRRLIPLGADSERITAIASGVDTGTFSPREREACRRAWGLPPDRPVALFIGRLHPWKGVREILEAAEGHPGCLFVLAGPGEVPDHPPNCRFTGMVEPRSVVSLINAADVGILPSYTEGISNFLMECLSCAVPVIATGVGGTPELVRHMDTGILIPPRDAGALSAAIRWMQDHPPERLAMGRRGREDMKERYEEGVLIDRMIRIHQGLLGRGG